MRILVISDGKAGYVLAEKLSLEKHDVTIIGSDEALKDAAESYDIMCIGGRGTSLNTQREAGAEHADIVIAMTESDEVNMLCCITTKKLGAKNTIARIRDPEYSSEAELLSNQLDIDYAINPEWNTAAEMLRLLRFPAAVEIDTFNQGRVEIVGFRVAQTDSIVGLSLIDLRKVIKAQVLFCMVERDGDVHIPRGDFVVQVGDLAYVAGKDTDVTRFFRLIGRAVSMAENVMILGGGRTGYYLTQSAARVGMKPTVIEIDEKRCLQLAESFPHATVICGDGTEPDFLESENIRGMDAFVALTGSDEENFMLSLFANRSGVPKVIAKADRLNYVPLLNSLGVESVISPIEITASRILHFVRGLGSSRGGAAISMQRMLDGRIEALEFIVRGDMRYIGDKIKDLPIKRGVVIAVISRGREVIVPEGNDAFMVGDNVVVVTEHNGFSELNDIFENTNVSDVIAAEA